MCEQPAQMRLNTSDRCMGWPPYSRPDQRLAFESGIDVIETHMGPHHVAEKEFQHASAQAGIGKVKAKDGIVSRNASASNSRALRTYFVGSRSMTS